MKKRYFAIKNDQYGKPIVGTWRELTEDEAYKENGGRDDIIQVTEKDGDFKVKAFQWYSSEGVFSMTVNEVSLEEALSMYIGAVSQINR
jgi:hypothetical protein